MQTPAPRKSRFEEAIMNSRSSIHPPPDMYLRDVAIDKLLDGFNQENNAPPARIQEVTPSVGAAPAVPASASSEGTFGRWSRAVSSFFHSSLGRRKAGSEVASSTAPPPPMEDRREQARLAYELAKEQGLLPAPQVFVRPQARARRSAPSTPLDPSHLHTTPTRILHKSASKKDLNKQKKLSKRVSNLEHKLAEARKELGIAIASKEKEKENATPELRVLPISPDRPLTPNNTHFSAEVEANATVLVESTSKNNAKITKKRKASEVKAVSIYGDSDVESEHESKKKKVVTPRRTSSRLVKKRSQASIITEEVIVVVPDGVSVPPIPAIPKDVAGTRVTVTDDGFGGLSHEIF